MLCGYEKELRHCIDVVIKFKATSSFFVLGNFLFVMVPAIYYPFDNFNNSVDVTQEV